MGFFFRFAFQTNMIVEIHLSSTVGSLFSPPRFLIYLFLFLQISAMQWRFFFSLSVLVFAGWCFVYNLKLDFISRFISSFSCFFSRFCFAFVTHLKKRRNTFSVSFSPVCCLSTSKYQPLSLLPPLPSRFLIGTMPW